MSGELCAEERRRILDAAAKMYDAAPSCEAFVRVSTSTPETYIHTCALGDARARGSAPCPGCLYGWPGGFTVDADATRKDGGR